VSESTIDRARRSGQLHWYPLNTRGVRIWSTDLLDWISRGMPLVLLVAVIGAVLLAIGCRLGIKPVQDALKIIISRDAQRPVRQGVRRRK
jgi:hypothetical protein